MIGVTGTDGKTTTVHMIAQILSKASKKVAVLSSLGQFIGDSFEPTGEHTTTPGAWEIQRFLRTCKGKGVDYVVLEVTSHALDQHRIFGIKFEIAVLTNITHEHLDYHKSFRRYVSAKARLFRQSRQAVLNWDDDSYKMIKKFVKGRIYSYSLFQATDFNFRKAKFSVSVPGRYNLYNALAAKSVAGILGIPDKKIAAALASFSGLPGRLEKIDHGQKFKVYVDFAHTPNGLRHVLSTLKKSTKGRLIAVFGAAGKRDVLKRPLMGEVASSIADIVILTAEDPRGEGVPSIIAEIAEGSKKSGARLGKNLFKMASRAEAIEYAIMSLAKREDTVVILGKGHERTINLDGKTELPWSDQKEASRAILRKIRYATQ